MSFPSNVYFDAYELPISVYQKVIDRGDLKPLIKDGKASPNQLKKCWENINMQVLELKLKDPEFIAEVEVKKDRAISLLEAQLSGNIAIRDTLLYELRQEAEKDKGDDSKVNVLDAVYRVGRYLKMYIPAGQMCLAEFIVYCDNAQKEIKRQSNGTRQD